MHKHVKTIFRFKIILYSTFEQLQISQEKYKNIDDCAEKVGGILYLNCNESFNAERLFKTRE